MFGQLLPTMGGGGNHGGLWESQLHLTVPELLCTWLVSVLHVPYESVLCAPGTLYLRAPVNHLLIAVAR